MRTHTGIKLPSRHTLKENSSYYLTFIKRK